MQPKYTLDDLINDDEELPIDREWDAMHDGLESAAGGKIEGGDTETPICTPEKKTL